MILIFCLLASSTGLAALSIDEALQSGIPLVFSRATALTALRSHFDGSISPPSYLHAHLHALRQLARASGSAAEVGARGPGSAWALFLGLVEGAEGAPAGAPPPLLRAAPRGGAPPALLAPLGRALGVDAAPLNASAPPPPVGLLLLDGARCHGALARDLALAAPAVKRGGVLVVAGTEDAGLVSEAVVAGRELGAEAAALGLRGQLHAAAGLKSALFDFLAAGGGEWSLVAHFPNDSGLSVLRRGV
jgi:hypothetical protein